MFAPSVKPQLVDKHVQARRLRFLGASLNEIAGTCEVSKSTVSLWVRDIELLPRHQARLQARQSADRGETWRRTSRARRLGYQEEGRQRAQLGDPLHVAGCMLCWAEGAKSRNTLKLANSDPAMMEMFVRFLRDCFSLTSDDLTFSLNVYTNNGLSIEQIEAYWMGLLGLSRRCSRKHMLNHYPTSSSGVRRNKLPYGVCLLTVKRSTWLVQHIYGAIQKYSGIDQPQWLDGPPRKPKA